MHRGPTSTFATTSRSPSDLFSNNAGPTAFLERRVAFPYLGIGTHPDRGPPMASPSTTRTTPSRKAPASVPLAIWPVAQVSAQYQRVARYHPGSTKHPGKMLPELARRIVAEYSRPGGLVVDPMAGIGTTVVEAAALGRRSVGIELEARWLDLAATNVEEVLAPTERSLVELRLGDATRLGEIGDDLTGRVDLVCTSPPYACEAGVIDKPAWIAGASLCPSDSLNYSTEHANLGHARGNAYEAGVARVYEGCFDLLRPGGVLAVVTKNTRRRGRMLDLGGLTVSLAREAGFTYLQHVVALHVAIRDGELVGRPSFWQLSSTRKARAKGDPAHLVAHEDLLVFLKPQSITKKGAACAH